MSEITKPILLDETGREMLNALNMIAIAQASNAGTLESWETVRQLVRQGLAPRAFPVGSRLQTTHSEYGNILLDVVAYDHHRDPLGRIPHSMTLLMHHCIYGRMIDNGELLWANTTEAALPAGTYCFTLYKGGNAGRTEEDGTYQFTTTKPIPVGGGWLHPRVGSWYADAASYKPENITGNTVSTYDADGSALESGLIVTASGEGTSLGTASNAQGDCVHTIGTFNSVMRRAYGSNNWAESAARQWLNTDAAANAWWKPQTIFDRAPGYINKAGFLAGLDAAFAAVLGEVEIETRRNDIYEIGETLGGTYATRDTFFLPSMAEIGLGANNAVTEGSVLPYYEGSSEADRIKYDIANPTTARYWWLRSPNPWHANYVRVVYPSGALGYSLAHSGHGLAAACVIY